MEIFKIVLTGGPRAGKTYLLNLMKKYLESKENNYVIVVPETATDLINNGLKPPADEKKLFVYQEGVYLLQNVKELVALNDTITFPSDAKIFIIHDRGILDNRAYLTDEKFDAILKMHNDYELRILDNYDMVFGLSSSAHIANQYETKSNTARYESEDEAKKLDNRTIKTWMLHRNYHIIEPTEDFNDKIKIFMTKLEEFCNKIVNKNIKRYLFEQPFDLNILNLYNAKKYICTEYYISSSFKDKLEIVERKTLNNYTSYTHKIKSYSDFSETYFIDKYLTEEEFNYLLDHNRVQRIVNKTIYTFMKDNHIYKLMLVDGKYFLEIETSLQNSKVNLPNELANSTEITNGVYYDLISNLGFGRTLLK